MVVTLFASAFAMIHCVAFYFIYYFQFTFGCTKTDNSKGKSGLKTRRRWIRFQRCTSNLLQALHTQFTEHLCRVLSRKIVIWIKSQNPNCIQHHINCPLLSPKFEMSSLCACLQSCERFHIILNTIILLLHLPLQAQKNIQSAKYSQAGDLL